MDALRREGSSLSDSNKDVESSPLEALVSVMDILESSSLVNTGSGSALTRVRYDWENIYA